MSRLKLGSLLDDKPVKMTIEVPGPVARDLEAYAAILAGESGAATAPPEKLIVPMIERFMATDRAFAKAKRSKHGASKQS